MSETARYRMGSPSGGHGGWVDDGPHVDQSGVWVKYDDHVAALAAARVEVEQLTKERDEHKARWRAIFDVRAFPRPEAVQTLLKRMPQRDAQVIDRAFAEGATLLAASEFEYRKLKRERDRLDSDLAAVRKVNSELRESLAICVHAHRSGSSVSPHLEAQAQRALAAQEADDAK